MGAAFFAAAGAARVPAVLAAATPDIGGLAHRLAGPVIAQHVDGGGPGARTGWVPAEALRVCGARGSLVNHSEHRLARPQVAESVRGLDAAGLVAVVCAATVAEARALARLHPPYLAIEPPELIGGDISVSSARPELLARAVEAVQRVDPNVRVLCGAGIHDREDVTRALALGTQGILVASAVARAADPGAAIDELLAGFRAARTSR